jgi:hypothetical protein
MPKKSPKANMKCGEVKKSTRAGKKIMTRYCGDGQDKIVHAGEAGAPNNHSDKARRAFKARHNCAEAKPGTPKHLACNKLWKKGGPSSKGKKK